MRNETTKKKTNSHKSTTKPRLLIKTTATTTTKKRWEESPARHGRLNAFHDRVWFMNFFARIFIGYRSTAARGPRCRRSSVVCRRPTVGKAATNWTPAGDLRRRKANANLIKRFKSLLFSRIDSVGINVAVAPSHFEKKWVKVYFFSYPIDTVKPTWTQEKLCTTTSNQVKPSTIR